MQQQQQMQQQQCSSSKCSHYEQATEAVKAMRELEGQGGPAAAGDLGTWLQRIK